MAKALESHTFVHHPHLTNPFESPDDPWLPFGNRLEFEWAYYHYVRLQFLAEDIQQGLDLWRATVSRHNVDSDSCDEVLWRNAKDMYDTIDSIAIGRVGWTTHQLSYIGPRPSGTVPCWMDESYELNVWDVLSIFEEQLASKEFDGWFEYTPYEEYTENGSCMYCNLMSGDWAFCEANRISQDKKLHGSMFIPIIAGSDKTTVSVATGAQEYYPVYASLGNITNTTQRGHGNGVVPVAFLPILKKSKHQQKWTDYQMFCHQLYHSCLDIIFALLKPYSMVPKVMKCPDGHFCHIVFGLGPYIADYPEQVWLTGIVSNWCAKCDALPTDLNGPGSHRCSHEKTDLLIETYDSKPFTHSFPRADIHELLSPDLLHQLIKGVFKDHLVKWVLKYLHVEHGEKVTLEIIEDIDRRISSVPPFPGLCWFADGCNFKQWTGDDSKALMKVFLGAIAGYVPSAMVRCVAAFMNACYIAHQNAINSPSLENLQACVQTYHDLRTIFLEAGLSIKLSMPHQHALSHFYQGIHLFGSPNGLCSSITESKHIGEVKDHWRQSSRNEPLYQMLRSIQRMDKMSVLRRLFEDNGMLQGFCFSPGDPTNHGDDEDEVNISGDPQDVSDFDVQLATKIQYGYPSQLHALAAHIKQPDFPLLFLQFLYKCCHPDVQIAPSTLEECPAFDGTIKVHHSAVTTFYAPSDLSGSGGLQHDRIRSTPSFFGHPRRDTAFVVTDDSRPGMEGLEIGCVRLFFSFQYRRKDYSCALINWFVHDDECDLDTGMWTVKQELDSHLLPVYGSSRVPEDFNHHHALDAYDTFFVNHFVDHHTHKFIGGQ
ncbi:hypothetical protein EI94DRAFT_1774037 [Lactarius quietus]|nr:hypothetical protein EI94DRAFT_1774037 [Lactarius quietus]